MSAIRIRGLSRIGEQELRGLCEVLVDCVEGGASVSFMWPMTQAKARAFWSGTAQALERGERLVFVAEDASGEIVGTAQIVLGLPENQPHRADLAKMLVHRKARRQGVGEALLIAAEQGALAAGKHLLVLDTASDAAERLYVRQGWQRCGRIPDFALLPDGAYCDTVVYYKHLAATRLACNTEAGALA